MAQKKPVRKPAPKKQTTAKFPKPDNPEMVEVNAAWLHGVLDERDAALKALENLQSNQGNKTDANVPQELSLYSDALVELIITQLNKHSYEKQNEILGLCMVKLKANRKSSIKDLENIIESLHIKIDRYSKELSNQQTWFNELSANLPG